MPNKNRAGFFHQKKNRAGFFFLPTSFRNLNLKTKRFSMKKRRKIKEKVTNSYLITL